MTSLGRAEIDAINNAASVQNDVISTLYQITLSRHMKLAWLRDVMSEQRHDIESTTIRRHSDSLSLLWAIIYVLFQ